MAFIRKNVVVYVYVGSDQIDGLILPDLMRKIDRDIIDGASYISMSDTITPPIVESVELSRTVFRKGEGGTIAIHGTDPSGHRIILYGDSYHRFGVEENNREIGADDRALDAFPGEPFEGEHTIYCWVVNEYNLFSPLKGVQVTF